MNNSKLYIAILATLLLTGGVAPAIAATSPTLGFAVTYGVLSSTYTNTVPGTTINGDVGFTTAPLVVPAGVHINYGSGVPYATAGIDQGAALVDLNSQLCTSIGVGAVALDTIVVGANPPGTFPPGCYSSGGAMDITLSTTVTLSGVGTYIFRPNGALTTGANSIVALSGASACDVFWTPTATTLGADSTMSGTIIDDSGITIGTNVGWVGRALSFASTVTTSVDDVITTPSCAPTTATLHIIKNVVNNFGGVASSSDFSMQVKLAGVDVAGSPANGTTTPGILYTLSFGTYVVSENATTTYTQVFSGDCDASGNITLGSGDDKTCTVTNSDIAPPPPLPPPVVALVTSSGGNGPIVGLLTQNGGGGSFVVLGATTTISIFVPTVAVLVIATTSPAIVLAAVVAPVVILPEPISLPTLMLPDTGFAPETPFFLASNLFWNEEVVSEKPSTISNRLIIPALNLDAHIESIGKTSGGVMAAPEGPTNVGWYSLGARPGEAGSAVINGHYGWKRGILAVFENLHKLAKGDTIFVTDEQGVRTTFAVRDVKIYTAKADVPELLIAPDHGAHLNLVTCAGTWNKATQSYPERLIVFADRVR